MTAAILSKIQTDAFAWQLKNFGKPDGLLMIAGMTEEFGEAQEHVADTERFIDGVSDCAIYCMQLCSVCGWDIGELWDARDLYEMPSRPWPILLGRISHHYVKGRVSRYRGTQQEHDVRCRAAISGLLKYWDVLLSGMGHDVISAIENTWKEVARRDWTKVRQVPIDDPYELLLVRVARLIGPTAFTKTEWNFIMAMHGANVGAAPRQPTGDVVRRLDGYQSRCKRCDNRLRLTRMHQNVAVGASVADGDGATHESIAAELGVTRARVQQIEAAAIRKLRAAARKLGLT